MSMILCKSEDNNCVIQDHNCEQENIRLTREEGGGGGGTHRGSVTMEHDEKRMRRQIANSNERRRMQSINAGFQSLRQLLPHHEGEKLSKAAILQQTAEYIYTLEQEKTRLLSQNCQLKRLIDQQDHGASGGDIQTTTATVATSVATIAPTGTTVLTANNNTSNTNNTTIQPVVATIAKKRKLDAIMTVQTISDSSDEGLGSMSPEPISLLTVVNSATGGTTPVLANNRTCGSTLNVSAKDYLDLKHQLDIEKRQKSFFEDQLNQLERQLRLQYDHQGLIDHADNLEEVAVSIIQKPLSKIIRPEIENVQVISLESNSVGKSQAVVCGPDLIEETIVPPIEKIIHLQDIKEEKVFIKRSRSRSPVIEPMVSLPPKKCRLPSILEAAIKAEPKVEVERIDSPSSIIVKEDHILRSPQHPPTNTTTSISNKQTSQQPSRMYITNTCRQNLETIVEAIRHLEGDAFDNVEPQAVQEVPLALTTNNKQQHQKEREHRQIQLDVQPYLKFRTSSAASTIQPLLSSSSSTSAPSSALASSIISVSITPNPQASTCHSPSLPPSAQQQTASQILQQHQQCRPGVIVVKQNS